MIHFLLRLLLLLLLLPPPLLLFLAALSKRPILATPATTIGGRSAPDNEKGVDHDNNHGKSKTRQSLLDNRNKSKNKNKTRKEEKREKKQKKKKEREEKRKTSMQPVEQKHIDHVYVYRLDDDYVKPVNHPYILIIKDHEHH